MTASRIYLLIALAVFLLDRFLKFVIFKIPALSSGIFNYRAGIGLRLFRNERFAWSWPVSNRASAILSLLILVVLALTFFRFRRRRKFLLPATFIFLGAASNLFDRLFLGGVIDYIVVPWEGIINLADVMIVVGLILVLRSSKID